MTDRIIYCANNCTKAGQRTQTEPPSQLCAYCEKNLHNWLNRIPDLYATVPTYLIPGTVDRNPDSVATKRSEVAAPVRLEVIDLLDTRLGRKWLGTAPSHDRRGTIGVLLSHAERIATERNLTTNNFTNPTVSGVCDFLNRHRLWVAEQDWINDLYDDLKQLHRALADANGEYRRPPVGHCHIETDNGNCGGPLFANNYGGVRCARCSATWDAAHLRQLGLAQAAAQETG